MAAAIDGSWISVRKMERDGQAFTITQTFDLKADGGKLTGAITMAFGEMEPRKADIKDGKIDGAKFTFSTTMSTPNGDFKMVYAGTGGRRHPQGNRRARRRPGAPLRSQTQISSTAFRLCHYSGGRSVPIVDGRFL